MSFMNNDGGHLFLSGAERIAGERWRQVDVEHHDQDHDAQHENGELAAAARVYLQYADWVRRYPDHPMSGAEFLNIPDDRGFVYSEWPWALDDFKPGDYVRCLEKAGALIAAEIDRLLAAQERA